MHYFIALQGLQALLFFSSIGSIYGYPNLVEKTCYLMRGEKTPFYFLALVGDTMRSNKLESGFQDRLVNTLHEMFPGCFVHKLSDLQGIPDLLVLYKDHWALLECKQSATAKHQPNQDYYVSRFDRMSFSRFIYPENKEEVLHELQQAFGV